MSTITNIAANDFPSDSRGVINTNFTNLNTDKMEGAASSTDNAIVRFDSTTGKVIQNSGVTISDESVDTYTVATPAGKILSIESGSGAELIASSSDLYLTCDTSGTVYVTGPTDIILESTAKTYKFKGTIASGILSMANIASSNKTFTFPNTSGTVALTSNKLSDFAATTSLELKGMISDETGSGSLVFADTPTLVTPVLGTPTSGTLTNCTGLPIASGVSGLGSNVGTFLATPSSANLKTAVTDETGSGSLVFADTPTLVTPVLGVATATSVNKVTITAPATSATLTIANSKTLTANNSITLAGTDSTTMTFPSTTATIARTDAGQTFTGTQLLAENASIGLDPAGSADGKFTGITVTATAGYTQSFGDLVYLDPTDSRWEAADANAVAGADGDARGLLGMVVVAGTDGTACTILLNGIIRADAKFPTFTINNPIYVSETAGSVTQTQPTTTDVVIRIVGAALTADEMYFNPSYDYITRV
jgi:hypothetical protein